MKRNDVMKESYKLNEVNDRGLPVCTCNQTLLLCGARLDYTRERTEKENDTERQGV